MDEQQLNDAGLGWLVTAGVNTLADYLGIRLLEAGPECVRAEMPVVRHVMQPFGVLHGGATVALAETVASIGGCLNVNIETHVAVGLEINANHLRPKTGGIITASATPIHRGSRTQVWDIRIADEAGLPVAIARCTLAVIPKPADSAERHHVGERSLISDNSPV